MPTRPPVFRSRHAPAPRPAWQSSNRQRHKRIRGRAGQRLRHQILAEEPLCRHCLELDKVSATEIVDHITPLAQGGSNERSNLQGLCIPCHDAKSKAEARAGRAARS
jgi:5-methylcytosine-specific restriction protein A